MSAAGGEPAGGVPPADDELRARAEGLLEAAARLWSQRNQKRWVGEEFIGELPVGVNQTLVVTARLSKMRQLLLTQRIWLQQPDGSRLATSWGFDLPFSTLPALMGVLAAVAERALAGRFKRTQPSPAPSPTQDVDDDPLPDWARIDGPQPTEGTSETSSRENADTHPAGSAGGGS